MFMGLGYFKDGIYYRVMGRIFVLKNKILIVSWFNCLFFRKKSGMYLFENLKSSIIIFNVIV